LYDFGTSNFVGHQKTFVVSMGGAIIHRGRLGIGLHWWFSRREHYWQQNKIALIFLLENAGDSQVQCLLSGEEENDHEDFRPRQF